VSTTIQMLWINKLYHAVLGGMLWCSWFRHCAMSHTVAGLIPDAVTGIFNWHDPSGCTMALGSTQPPTEMNTRYISWEAKPAGMKGWQLYQLHVPNVLKSWRLNLLEPSGPVQACTGLLYLYHSPCRMSLQHKHVEMGVRWLMSTTGGDKLSSISRIM